MLECDWPKFYFRPWKFLQNLCIYSRNVLDSRCSKLKKEERERERERSNLIKQLFQSDDFFQTTKDYYTFFHRSFSQHHLIFVTVPSFFPFSFFPFFPFSLFFPHCIDIPLDENRMRIFTKPRNVRLKFARIFPITAIPSFPICFLTLSPPSRNYVHPKRDVRVFFEIVCAKSGERRESRYHYNTLP